jgi:thiol-disulfide isomerase/thioredoxin
LTISFILLFSIQLQPSSGESEVITYETKEVIQSAAMNLSKSGTTSPMGKVVLVEMYTATWCIVCAVAEPELDVLSDEFGQELAILEYHPYPDSGGDIFGFGAGNNRMANYYGFDTFPSTVFDGVIKKVGVSGSAEELYSSYKTYIEQRLKKEPMASINIKGSFEGNSMWINVSFETDGYFSQDLHAMAAIFEDDIYYNYSGSNGITNHRFVVREIILDKGIDINATHSLSFNGTFQVDPEWNASKIGVVAFVQADYKTRYAANMGGLGPEGGDLVVLAILIAGIAMVVIISILFILRGKKIPDDSKVEQKERGNG